MDIAHAKAKGERVRSSGTSFQIELLWGKQTAILFQRYKSNCQLAEAGVTGRTELEWAWLVAYKYAEIKLPEVEKSQPSETHKSGGEGSSGGGQTRR